MINVTSPTIVNIKDNKETKLLTAKDNVKLEIPNSNTMIIKDLCVEEEVGSQIDVKNYCVFDTGSYLITISCMKEFLVDERFGESIPPQLVQGNTVIKKGDYLVSRNASMGKLGYVDKEIHGILNGGLSKLRFKSNYEHYIIAYFLTEYVSKYLEIKTSKGGTQQNAKRSDLLNVPIPFPNKNNHENPQVILNYISFLVKLRISKEKEMKRKNQEIDTIIYQELYDGSHITFSKPKINEVKKIGKKRLDTSYTNYDFKLMYEKITQYKNGYFLINTKNIKPGKTPKKRMYFKEDLPFNNLWITPKNISKRRLDYKSFIFTDEKTRVRKNDIIISSVRHLGYSYYVEDEGVYANQNTLIIRNSSEQKEQLFLLCYLSSEIGLKLQKAAQITGLVPIIYSEDFNNIPIPNFENSKKEKVVELYYNKVDKDYKKNININNVNWNELQKRAIDYNQSVGVYQLNKDIIYIDELLSDYIDKIIENKPINKLIIP